jgi:hypothetical protein
VRGHGERRLHRLLITELRDAVDQVIDPLGEIVTSHPVRGAGWPTSRDAGGRAEKIDFDAPARYVDWLHGIRERVGASAGATY